MRKHTNVMMLLPGKNDWIRVSQSVGGQESLAEVHLWVIGWNEDMELRLIGRVGASRLACLA